ncbi:MAG TPA: rod shape-determining protein MreC, partial [Myxococcaceae bacterium]|nr:rod shape-determining protein MreC [Myxococcaceae bacterium]
MLSFLKRHREPLLVCLILAHALGMFLGSSRRVREPNLVDRIALAVTAPVQRGAVATVDGLVNAWQQYVSLRSVRREN